tara:strand:+ start:1395 stop:1742 length:348 start_codon:yes stop_codon:yes gene_type:complete
MRKIRIDQIDDVMKEAVEDLVASVTLQWAGRVKRATPVDTGRLRSAWQTEIKSFEGTVVNNVVYAEPVCFGINKPASWGGVYRTKKGTVEGFPEIIGKELEQYARKEYEKIKRSI